MGLSSLLWGKTYCYGAELTAMGQNPLQWGRTHLFRAEPGAMGQSCGSR